MISQEKFSYARRYLILSDRVFRKLKDRNLLNNKQKREIKNKLELLNYYVLLNNPKIKKTSLRNENLLSFLHYLENLNRSSKSVSNI